MELSLRPTQGNIILEPHESSSSQTIITTDKDMYERGIVLKVGDPFISKEGIEIESPCKVGDRIIYQYGKIEEIHEKGKAYRIIPFSQVVGVYINE